MRVLGLIPDFLNNLIPVIYWLLPPGLADDDGLRAIMHMCDIWKGSVNSNMFVTEQETETADIWDV